jgi:hypothetical protein
MLNFLKGLLGLTLIVLLGYGLYHLAVQGANDSLKTLRVSADNTTTLVGTVLVNQNDCLVQGAGSQCFLKIRIEAVDVYVIYNTNDNGFCRNEIAAAIGKNTKEGTAIKVHGYYRKDGKLDTVLTCPSQDYSIENL